MAIEIRDRLKVGESVGLYTVVESDDRHLRLAFGSGVGLFIFLLGVAFTFLDVWLFKTGWIRAMRGMPTLVKGAIIGLPLCGLAAVVMLGRSFEFRRAGDAGSASVRRRWLWVFGPQVEAQRVAAVRVLVRPGYGSNAADRIQVDLLDAGGGFVIQVADESSDGRDVGAVVALALQISDLLGKPVRVEGEVKEMSDQAKDAVRRFRERVAGIAPPAPVPAERRP